MKHSSSRYRAQCSRVIDCDKSPVESSTASRVTPRLIERDGFESVDREDEEGGGEMEDEEEDEGEANDEGFN